jgi:hypothetical protein
MTFIGGIIDLIACFTTIIVNLLHGKMLGIDLILPVFIENETVRHHYSPVFMFSVEETHYHITI